MKLNSKSITKLRILINEETEYRSGPQLVEFFSKLGFNDTYGQGFPSRWKYTEDRLNTINGTSDIDKCIKELFAPFNFIGKFQELDKHINEFNQYLAFDGWKVIRKEKDILFSKADTIDFSIKDIGETDSKSEIDNFLKKEFDDISIHSLGLESELTKVIKIRIEEIKNCLASNSPLALIFLAGSTLEGILLGIATKYPMHFNKSKVSPKDKDGKVLPFTDWTLNTFIDVAKDVGLLEEDVKKFSHVLKDFRNYIHPYQQMNSRFNPDINTAKICWQVLRLGLSQINSSINKLK